MTFDTQAVLDTATTTRPALRDVVSEQGLVFAAITLVLLVTGVVSGITGVVLLAAVTLVLSVVATVAHAATVMTSPTPRS